LNFICSQLASDFKAGADETAACTKATAATSKCHFTLSSFQPSNSSNISSPAGKTGQAAADAFNTAIGGAAKPRRAVGSNGLDFGKCTPTMDFQAG
jgi:hypothetical protein